MGMREIDGQGDRKRERGGEREKQREGAGERETFRVMSWHQCMQFSACHICAAG